MALIDTTTESNGNSNNTSNIITGTEFDDQIIAGLADQQTYTTTNPQGKVITHMIQDNDIITGGAGDDVMTGGYGSDTFIFNFTVASCVVTHDVLFRDGDAPSVKADHKAWVNYTAELAAWRSSLTEAHGADEAEAYTFDVDIAVKKASPLTQNFTGDNSFAWSETVTSISGEGHDSILDWGNGNDMLHFAGLSTDQAADNYWGNWLTADTLEDGQTIISFDGGSITLVGVDTTLDALITGGQLLFV
jgi:hypothetical protein